jgi:hypothetical protein
MLILTFSSNLPHLHLFRMGRGGKSLLLPFSVLYFGAFKYFKVTTKRD